ncbi:ComF family protein [Georgenia sp. H159]|uniref:ComF family protein n=1 Tax=Georgenia sp. H159 TaxID=3076115 RepID=UPI002D76F80B|nr:ComF family protein [Georgenia sp. H159]
MPERSPSARARWVRAVADGLSLVLPTDCAGCGAWDVAVCPGCRDLVSLTPVRSDRDAPMLSLPGDAGPLLPVWSLADYAGPVRGLVLAWKRTGRADVGRVLLDRARRGAQVWAHDPDLLLDGDVVVMPAPSGWRRRTRGLLVAADLADAVAAGIAVSGAMEAGRSVRSVDALRRSGGRAHQTGLGARARARNRTSGVRLLAPPGREDVVVLVDDVLTTGATLATCARVLTRAGARVAGALVLAATPPPGRVGPTTQVAPANVD